MEKLYYSISEVAEMLGLAQSTLRFWEKEFPQLRPRLTSGGTRKYTTEDINLVRTIKYLLKGRPRRLSLPAYSPSGMNSSPFAAR